MRNPDNHANRSTFNARFKQLRDDRQMSQASFARYLGIARGAVASYESTDPKTSRLPDAENLMKICNVCNVSADYLLGLSDKKTGVAEQFSKDDIYGAFSQLGLSTASAKSIIELKQNRPINIKCLDELLSSKHLSGVITIFDMYINAYTTFLQFSAKSDIVGDTKYIHPYYKPLGEIGYVPVSFAEYKDYFLNCRVPSYLQDVLEDIGQNRIAEQVRLSLSENINKDEPK